ncbi:AraC family transcriptional regulator ligand-binding domain-containing protein [Oleiharenicola lentus]|uniref:AraC family transcriptional regulator n=1 Tax=Oleiharenicola lentus TaxID=2508720 RepID=UPI003F669874
MNTQPPDRFKVAHAFWHGLAPLGLTPAAVLRQSRLPMALFDEEKTLVSTEQFFALWRAVEELSTDAAAGLKIGSFPGTGSYHPLLVAAQHSRTYRDCLQRMARYKQFCSPEEMRLTETKDESVIDFVWTSTTEAEPKLLTDAAFALVTQLGRGGTGTAINPKRVELMRKIDASRTHEEFFKCPVKHRAPRNAIVFHRTDLDRGFITHNAELLEMLSGHWEKALQDRATQTRTSDRVKWILKRLLAGNRPDIDSVARELGMGTRTLQRKITDEGLSFRQLLLEARKELVREYLLQPSIEITEAAYLLGYDDPNSFYRAFRSWEGTTPADWRSAHRDPTETRN